MATISTITLQDDSPHPEPFATTFVDAVRRAKADFLEMPGLCVTAAQARRLWAFEPDLCAAVLCALVEARFLVCSRNTMFLRAE